MYRSKAALKRQRMIDLLKIIGIGLLVVIFAGSCIYFTQQAAQRCEAQGGIYEYDDGECEVDGEDLVEYDD